MFYRFLTAILPDFLFLKIRYFLRALIGYDQMLESVERQLEKLEAVNQRPSGNVRVDNAPPKANKIFAFDSQRSHFFDHKQSQRWISSKLTSQGAALLAETRPLVSVILPTRNRARSVVSAVQSVLSQSYDNWELLLIDDGSTDDTLDSLQRNFSDPRMKVLQSGGKGVCEARNCGLREARGEFVAYLDSDNSWTPRYLELMLISLLDSGADSAYSVLRCINAGPEYYRQRRFDYEILKLQNYIDLNVFVHNRSVLNRVGLFDVSLRRLVDWDFILRVTDNQRVEFANFIGVAYDAGPASDRITNAESPSYQNVVRNKHWIDWMGVDRAIAERDSQLTSVIICVLDQPDLTDACLRSLFEDRSMYDFEVILVDNGSELTTKNVLSEWATLHENIKVITNPINFDFALGNNIGFAASRGMNVVFLNSDTEVTHEWAQRLVERLRRDDEIGAVAPRLLYGDSKIQCAGMVFSEMGKIPYHIYRGQPGTADCVNQERYFQALTGACLAVRAEDFAKLRGFNPLYINGCEDVDLCFRLRQELGRKLLYDPSSLVYHHEGASKGRSKYIAYNRGCFVETWGSHVVADDVGFYEQDGFTVTGYTKPGREADGDTALYMPTICPKDEVRMDAPSARVLQVGVISIWHIRGISLMAKQCCDALEAGPYRTHVLARWESARFFNSGPAEHPRVTNLGDDPTAEDTVHWARMNALDLIIFMEVHPNDWKRVRALREAGFKVMALEMLDVLRRQHLDRYAMFDGFICIAHYHYNFFRSHFPKIPAILIPWGVSDIQNNLVAKANSRRDGLINFVHIAGWGGVNDRKNTDLLIRAFARAAPPHARLHLYTLESFARCDAESRELVRANNNIVVHEGVVPNIAAAYEGMDVLLCPSNREGIGLPILESLAAGLPVVIADGYMMKQWIVPGEHGLVLNAMSHQGSKWLPEMEIAEEALADGIRYLCREPSRLKRFRQAVAHDRDVWTWSWQPEVMQIQLRRFIHSPKSVDEPNSYLPEFIRDFERRRASHMALKDGFHKRLVKGLRRSIPFLQAENP